MNAHYPIGLSDGFPGDGGTCGMLIVRAADSGKTSISSITSRTPIVVPPHAPSPHTTFSAAAGAPAAQPQHTHAPPGGADGFGGGGSDGSRKAKKAGTKDQAKLMQDITDATDEALVRLRSRIAQATMHWL